jgi:hypothetical protein
VHRTNTGQSPDADGTPRAFSLCAFVAPKAQEIDKLFLMAPANEKQHAHELIDRMPMAQVSAIVQMIEARLDPVSRAIANAPIDDEPESEVERRAVAASKAWLEKHPGQGVSLEDLSTDLGISVVDLKRS